MIVSMPLEWRAKSNANTGAPLLTEEHAAPGSNSDWSMVNAIADTISEMGLNGKKLSMKQLRYINDCILQGKTVTLADVMSV